MALIPLSIGNYIVPFIGTADLTIGSQSWFTAANVNLYKPADNRSGYVKNAGGSNQTFAGSFAAFHPPIPGGDPVGYIFEVKVPFSIDGAFFGAAVLIPRPVITALSPLSLAAGNSLTVTGTNLGTLGYVLIGGVSAAITGTPTATSATVTIPLTVATGNAAVVAVTMGGYSVVFNGLTITSSAPSAPTISSLSPSTGAVGAAVTITGTNLTGATAVTFNGVAATFTVISATSINATAPAGGTGTIAVTTAGGTATSTASFTVTTITSVAATPTGIFNAAARVYTVSIGAYPLSRLLISTAYAPFTAATTLSYQISAAYLGPEEYRFKISATAAEAESAILNSPAFPPDGTLIDLPTGLVGLIQSNGAGFAPVSQVPVAERGPFALGLINAYTRNALESYQLGVNDEGLPAGLVAGYERGFGLDYQYMQRVQTANAGKQLILKKNISRGTTTDNASFAKWETVLMPEYLQELQQAFALCAAQGFRPVVKWLFLDIYESAPAIQADYINGYMSLINQLQAPGYITAATKILVRYSYTGASNVNQAALIATNPARFFKIDVGTQVTIDGTHIGVVGQKAVGNAVYDLMNPSLPPPTATPPAGTTELEPTGTPALMQLSPLQWGVARTADGGFATVGAAQGQVNGLSTGYLPANLSGRVYFIYSEVANQFGAVGFKTEPTRGDLLGAFSHAVYVTDNGTLSTIENGAGATTTEAAVIGTWYGVQRVGSTGVVRIIKSADQGVTWTSVKNYATANTSALYVSACFAGPTVKLLAYTQSLAPLDIPTAGGRLVSTVIGGAYGALGSTDITGLVLPEATYWLSLTPSEFSFYKTIFSQGFIGNASVGELFSVSKFDTDLVLRVQTSENYKYAYCPLGNVSGTRITVVLRLTATTIQLFVNDAASPISPALYRPSTARPIVIGASFAEDTNLLDLPNPGVYYNQGIANRAFTDAEIAQVIAAQGNIDTIAGTVRRVEFENLLVRSLSINDRIDPTKKTLIFNGNQ